MKPFAKALFFWPLLLCLLPACKQEKVGLHPAFTSLTEAVYATALVEADKSYTVYPSVSGIIERSNLEEGMQVGRGEVLFRVRAAQAELEQSKARTEFEEARNNAAGVRSILNEMIIDTESAALQLSVDSSTYARQSRLWDQNIGSRQAFEAAQLQFETSRNRLRELRLSQGRTEGELTAKLALARTTLDQRRQTSEDHLVRAALDGTVYEVLREVGESVTPQTELASIGSTDDFILRLSIDEVDVARVEPDQTVVILLDAYGEETFTAKITEVLPHKDERTQTYTAEARFEGTPPQLFSGLAGEANIVIARRGNVMTLPVEWIGPGNVVQTAEGPVTIVTGATDYRHTEIVSGIDTATVVYEVN